MKSGVIVVTVAGLVIVCGIAYAFVRNSGNKISEPASSTEKPQASDGTVRVDDLAEHPEKFEDEITLRAVVAGVNKSEGVFSVIDSQEFESCGVLTCAKNYLPVKFNGELPELRTIVEIRGQVAKSDKGLVFKAKRVDLVK